MIQKLQLYHPRPSQKMLFDSQARFLIWACGRRWGKTISAENWSLRNTWELKGENWWVCPIYKIGLIAWRRLEAAVPREAVRKISQGEMRMELVSGGAIEVRSADNPENLRGEGLTSLVIDEAARVSREAWEEALRPSLSDTAGRALFISTPKGRNWFFDLWTRGQDQSQGIYESWRFPSWDNPKIPQEDIEQARASLPADVFRQEFEAEFLEDSAGVFRNIKACIRGELQRPVEGKRYYAGLDLARLTDFTVLAILDSDNHLCFFDRFNRIDWTFQKRRIIESVKAYNAKVSVDSTGVGDPIFEDLRREGLSVEGFKFTSESKNDLIQSLAIAFEQEKISIPPIKELINELMTFEYEIGKTGNVRYGAPEGYHDDCVIGLALANWSATKNREPNFLTFTRGAWETAAKKFDPAIIGTRRCPLTGGRMSKGDSCDVPRRKFTCDGCPARST